MAGPHTARIEKQKTALALRTNGASMAEIAKTFGVTSNAVRYWLKDEITKTQLKSHTAKVARENRNQTIADLYLRGDTMEDIGLKFGLSRERVRQILEAFDIRGVKKISQAHSIEAATQKRIANRLQTLWGLSIAEYESLKRKYGPSSESGSPIQKFMSQRRNAAQRGIAWEFTFIDWWNVWQASGKWTSRGRGKGYCMARFDDVGPYAVGNVEIIPAPKNIRDYHDRKRLTKTF